MNLLTSPPRRSTSSTITAKNRLSSATTSAGSCSVGVRRGALEVDEEDAGLARLSPELDLARRLGGALGHLAADVAAEEVAQLLALAQPGRHPVEPDLQQTDLGAVEHHDLPVELAALDVEQRVPHGEDRVDHGARREHRDEQAEDEHDGAHDDGRDAQPGDGHRVVDQRDHPGDHEGHDGRGGADHPEDDRSAP